MRKQFTVYMRQEHEGEVTVWAEDVDDACEKAEALPHSAIDWEVDATVEAVMAEPD